MASNNNGNRALIRGALLGIVAGAAYALWKAPMSGAELRSKLAKGPVGQRDEIATDTPWREGVTDKIVNVVEQTLAPIVGVELGKTAKLEDQPVPAAQGESASAVEHASEAVAQNHAGKTVVWAPTAKNADPEDWGTASIRAKHYSWGSPTPDPVALFPSPADADIVQPVSAEPPVVAAAEEVERETGAVRQQEHHHDPVIRTNRFGWGTPAPDPVTMAPDSFGGVLVETPHTLETDVVKEAEELAVQNAAAEQAAEAEAAEVQTPVGAGGQMRQFPKLGGLEN